MTYHTTVLLHEGVEVLRVKPDGVYVDATFGGGGHSRLILERLGSEGRVVALDQDADVAQNVPYDNRFTLCEGNFRFLRNYLGALNVIEVDGILADLGVSGFQFDEPDRGFSFRHDAPLDMRMNRMQELSAQVVVAEYEEIKLKSVLRNFGETPFAGQIARAIIRSRELSPISTTGQLKALIERVVPPHKSGGELPKVFQAIRIEVNDELGALRDFLIASADLLKMGGRLVVISYHSLEDRLVKHFMRSGNFEDNPERDLYGNIKRPMKPIGKVVEPSTKEIESNPRGRSARMRVAERN